MDGLKRFIEDLAHPSDPANEGPSPAKRARLSEGVTSVFQQAVVPFESRSDHGHWTLLNENENSATFGFAMGTWQLQFILGHSLSATGGQGLGIKHWAIRKAILNINRHPEADPSIKLADYLFSKDWTPEKLSSVFKTTKNLQKGLGLFGADVNNAMQFILGTIRILRKHFTLSVLRIFVHSVSCHFLLSKLVQLNFFCGITTFTSRFLSFDTNFFQHGLDY